MFALESLPRGTSITAPRLVELLRRQGYGRLLDVKQTTNRMSQHLGKLEARGYVQCTEQGQGRRPSTYTRTAFDFFDEQLIVPLERQRKSA